MKRKHLLTIITLAAVLLVIILTITNSCSKNGINTMTPAKTEKKIPPFIVKPGPETPPPPPEKPPAIARYKLSELYERGEDWVVKMFGAEYLKTCGTNWTVEDYNTVLENQARIPLEGVHSQVEKPYAEITTEYFEKNYQQNQQIALDIRIAKSDTIDYYTFAYLPYTLNDLTLDQLTFKVEVGDLVLINIRTLTPFPPSAPIMGYFTGTGMVYGIFVIPGLYDPEKWAKIITEIKNPGYVNIGTKITGLSKSILLYTE